MKTGFDPTGSADGQTEQYMEAMSNIMIPVIEKGMLLACEYAKACGRNVVLMKDVEYAMKYCAMHEVGQKIGSHFPEIYEGDDDDEEDMEILEEGEGEFTRYSGEDAVMNKINESYDLWDSWVPMNPSERILKNAIDNNGH
mgnify:CR=1 FL=1